jgi:histidine triad (HIT) family protein
MNFALPLDILHETNTLLAFYHPRPSHPFHVVLLPKQQIISLEGLSPQDQVFLSDLFSTVRTLVNKFDLARDGYHLIVNGGKYQEFGLLHFHLISDVVQGSS